MTFLLRYFEDKYITQKIQHSLLTFLQEYLCLVLLYWTFSNFLIFLRTVFLSTGEK